MAVLQLISDTHLDHHQDAGMEFLRTLNPEGVDILVVAGDLCSSRDLTVVVRHLCGLYPEVVFVAGNHEFYHSSVDNVLKRLAKLDSELDNFTWLNCKVAEVRGVTFVGGTLWFPMADERTHDHRNMVNDFNLIKEFEPWVYEENLRCEAVLLGGARHADVVVTHHVPTTQCIAERFMGEPLNHFFVRDLTTFIERVQPPLWLYGHSHTSSDKVVARTRLVANPLGYPWEQGQPDLHFDSRLLIEV